MNFNLSVALKSQVPLSTLKATVVNVTAGGQRSCQILFSPYMNMQIHMHLVIMFIFDLIVNLSETVSRGNLKFPSQMSMSHLGVKSHVRACPDYKINMN
jgi:hypothetical protein